MKERPIIGIITAQAADSEQRQLLDGMIEQAQALGADTAVLSNIYNSSEYFADVEIENKIYDLILCEKLDGLILTAESFLNPTLQQEIYKRIVSRPDTPVIVTGAQIEGLDCIDTDVRSDIHDIICHLIDVHGFTDIDFLTGHKGNDTSVERVNGYRDALIEHGIPFDSGRIIYGDFWHSSGEKLAYEYISGRRHMPQAIACANDYMAFGLCDVLAENGIRIPEDVTVTGYEYIGERYCHTPILTTFRRNRKALGARAVTMLYNKMTGSDVPLPPISGHMVAGNSCGCGADTKQLCAELSALRRENHYSKMNLVGNFEQQLSTCRSVSEYVHVLQEFAYLVRDISGMYLCLFDNWCSTSGIPAPKASIDDPMVCYTVMRPDGQNSAPAVFRASNEFVPVVNDQNSGLVLYLCPIFFSGRYFGFFILQYPAADGYDMIFRDWLKIASNGLELLRMKNDITTLLECQDLSVLHDRTTGLLNMDGMRNELRSMLKTESNAENAVAVLIRTDVFAEKISIADQSKSISDERVVADILRSFTKNGNNCCGKTDDKTYVIVCTGNYSEKSAALLADKLSTLIFHTRNESPSSIVTEFGLYDMNDLDMDEIYKELYDRSNERIYQESLLRRNASFAGYAEIRGQIYAAPNEDFRAEKLCRSIGHSAGYFRAMYKELFGLSFHQDLIRSRISYAKLLILTDSASFSSIAARCGYNDEKHFYHQFRQITGLSPKQYRAS